MAKNPARVPLAPLLPHLPSPGTLQFLKVNSLTYRKAMELGLSIPQARRWARKAGVRACDIWPNINNQHLEFWSRVDKRGPDECWPWVGAMRDGYGIMQVEGRARPAHTYSLELHSGVAKPAGMDTCHACDNPPCVNPAHLRFDSRQGNVDDAVSRHRNAEGPTHGSRKLEAGQVIEIFQAAHAGERYRSIASNHGVTVGTIKSIVNGRTWKSLQHMNPKPRRNA